MFPHPKKVVRLHTTSTSEAAASTIRERLSLNHPGIEFCDHLDDAIIGSAQVWTCRGELSHVALYNYEKAVQILVERLGMADLEASETIDDRSMWTFMGEKTPAFAHLQKGG